MAFCTLHRFLRHVEINAKGAFTTRNYTMRLQSQVHKNSGALFIHNPNSSPAPSAQRIKFSPRTINIDVELPSNNLPIGSIIKFPILPNLRITEPPSSATIGNVDEISEKSLELPSNGRIIEKQAARLIVIRRRKMKKHKLRKLRKKMKFEWAKIRQRREMRKEKIFQAELLSQINEAEKFNAVQYVAEKIQKATEIPIPKTWKGKRLPEFIIKQLMGLDKKTP